MYLKNSKVYPLETETKKLIIRLMTVYKTKSDQNILASSLLIQNNCCNSSIHSTYYSIIQLIIFVLVESNVWTLEEINIHTKEKGSHNWLFREVQMQISNRIKRKQINDQLQDLKTARNNADYKEKIYGQKEAKKALQKAKDIELSLKENFKI